VQFVENYWGCGNGSNSSGAYRNPKYIENNTGQVMLDAIEKTEREMQQSRASQYNRAPQPRKAYTKKQDKAFNFIMFISGIGLIYALILGVQAA
jgi:CHASE3 domain sensor protein